MLSADFGLGMALLAFPCCEVAVMTSQKLPMLSDMLVAAAMCPAATKQHVPISREILHDRPWL
jgi:hypothetical protein